MPKTQLTDLQLDVVRVLWSDGEATVAEVRDRLPESRTGDDDGGDRSFAAGEAERRHAPARRTAIRLSTHGYRKPSSPLDGRRFGREPV